jgi:MFS family permease
LATAATAGAGLTTAQALGLAAAVGAAVSLAAGPRLLKTDEATTSAPEPAAGGATIPWRPIVLIGVAMMMMFIADSATSNWSTVYLDDVLHASPSVAALGLFAYQLCMVGGRSFGDRLVRRHGMAPMLRIGAVVGGAGLLLAAAAPVPAVGIAGFALQGLGLCIVVPLSFSAAGRLDPAGTGEAIARVNLFNYAGFVIGAGLIGAVAELASLRLAFVVPALLTTVIVLFATAFEPPAAERSWTPATAPTAADVQDLPERT